MLLDCNAYGEEHLEYPTVSEGLADNRVVKVSRLEDGRFEVREMCDEWASARLTPEQLRAWGQELIDLANNAARVGGTPYLPRVGSPLDSEGRQ